MRRMVPLITTAAALVCVLTGCAGTTPTVSAPPSAQPQAPESAAPTVTVTAMATATAAATPSASAASASGTIQWGDLTLTRDQGTWNLYNLFSGADASYPIDRSYQVRLVSARFASDTLTVTAHRVRLTGDDPENQTVHTAKKLLTLRLESPVVMLNPPTEDQVDAADFARHVTSFKDTVFQVLASGSTPLALQQVYFP
ncbi:MAG: hypothetical protein QM779_00235 [Propionicimonas sp.]|uniref:hypothetical protein n=1 Tax=Propionicimonas sp. TaxID=1955623 RepID=UPI003D10AF80